RGIRIDEGQSLSGDRGFGRGQPQLVPEDGRPGDGEHQDGNQRGRVAAPGERGAETFTPSAPSSWRMRAASAAEPGVSPWRHRVSNATGTRLPSLARTSPSVIRDRTWRARSSGLV